MNSVWEFILSIVMVFSSSSDPCHVFGLDVKDDVGGELGIIKSGWFSRGSPLGPVKQQFSSVSGHGIINSNRHELKLSSIHRAGSVWMGNMKVSYSPFGGCDVRHWFPSFFLSWITFPMDKVLHLSPSKSGVSDEVNFVMQITLYLNRRWRWRFLLRREFRWSERGEE